MNNMRKFMASPQQIEWYKTITKTGGKIRFNPPRRAGVTTFLKWLQENEKQLFEELLKTNPHLKVQI